ncbi:MAG: ISAzo13 family transposase, partial [Chloroflexota bacterium]
METNDAIRQRFTLLTRHLDERTRRLLAAAEALTLGRGGVSAVARATGMSQMTIQQGIKDVQQLEPLTPGRVRKPGGGRKTAVSQDPTLLQDLESLVEPVTRGDPESPLRWTSKSLRKLAGELQQLGHRVSHRLVGALLHTLKYSLQANSKTLEGGDHPDRDAQFAYLNQQAQTALDAGEPVISVDAKKKELVGNFKNGGRELRPKGEPEQVQVYDFVDKELGRATPYGIYDVARNTGWVNVGIDHDTAAFAVESIRRWWQGMGQARYPEATKLLVNADGGGSNGSRVRLWKWELQKFADETGLAITVGHLPPGTSKGNKIEHRLFSFITQNWRGKPLVSHAVIVNLIAGTKNTKGLRVECRLDTKDYATGSKVT